MSPFTSSEPRMESAEPAGKPKDPHYCAGPSPQIKVTQSKTATIHHTVKTQREEGLYSNQGKLCPHHPARFSAPRGLSFLPLFILGILRARRWNFKRTIPQAQRGCSIRRDVLTVPGKGGRKRPPGNISTPGWPSAPPTTSLDPGASGLSPQTQQTPKAGLAHISAIPRTELFTNLRPRAQVPAAQVATAM